MNPVLLALLVAVAGGAGSTLRFLIDVSIPAAARERFPWGTWIINITGSFVLGLIAGPLSAVAWGRVLTVGLLGGYTTFSAASLETVTLAEDGRYVIAVLYGIGTLIICVAASLLGIALTT